METSTLTSKGQVTIPKAIRDRLELQRGDRLSFSVRADGVIEVAPVRVDLLDLCELFDPPVKGLTLQDIDEATVAGARRACEWPAT